MNLERLTVRAASCSLLLLLGGASMQLAAAEGRTRAAVFNDGKQEFAVYGRNITDEIEAVGAIDFNNLTGFVNEPRRYFVEFRSSF